MALIKSKMVPDEAAKAALEYFDGYDMKEAIAAALSAWPGAVDCGDGWIDIPLKQEASDE